MTAAPPDPPLLFVDDDEALRRQLRWSFAGREVRMASDRETAIAAVRTVEPAVVVLDLGLPPDADGCSEGFRTLQEILSVAPETKVIVMTGNSERANAVRAVGLGAYDFYEKPVEAEVLGLIIDRACRLRALEDENRRSMRGDGARTVGGLIGASPVMHRIASLIEKVAPTDVTVLLTGESGTGKEVVAQALHRLGPRGRSPFVAINCGAIPEPLLESELFGHEKGAFTGAIRQTRGKVELAHRGTLFLDEIGDLPSALQVKLLRMLEERTIERIGGRQPIAIDVRIVSATNQDLRRLIAEGRFREDLYYRLNAFPIELPPLSVRDGDAALLAHHFLHACNAAHRRTIVGFGADALAAIEAHPWPGNVRELQNRVERAVIMAEGRRITAADLGLEPPVRDPRAVSIREARAEAERAAVRRALAQSDGNVSKAARLLGISRPTLYDLIRQHDIKS